MKAYFLGKQTKEKFRIFEQNSGLTLGKNSNFFTFLKKHFYSLESLSFHLEYQLKYISRLIFFRKTNNGIIYNFWPKPWTNPFWKILNLQYLTKIVKLKIQFFVNFLKSFFISLESLSFHLCWKPYDGKFPIFEENRWPSPLG